MRDRWSPIFDRFAVDLVINGHNHCYERTHPLKAGKVTAHVASSGIVEPATQGTTYITAGGGGQAAYQAALFPTSYVTVESGARVPEDASWSAFRFLDVSFIAVDVTPPAADGVTTMKVRALRKDGILVESVTLRRARAVVAAAAFGGAGGASTDAPQPDGSVAPERRPTAAPASTGSEQLPSTGPEAEATAAAALATAGAAAALAGRRFTRDPDTAG